MKKILIFFFSSFLLINLFILISGKKWIYNAIGITYLKGYTSSYIEDFIYFPSDTIKAKKHQKWLVSKNYNTTILTNPIKEIHKKLETIAFLVIKNDSICYEKYWDGYSVDSMSNSFSMSKSWVSTLIGIAISDGKIKSVDQKVCDFLPEFNSEKNSKISIKDLLTMSSGLDWDEDYYNPFGKIANAYYGDDLKKLIINLKLIKNPGEIFNYNSACTQLLTYVLEAATNQKISVYASNKLWGPMGAKNSALWSTDTEGGSVKGFCCINSNARDFARIGKLYLKYGNWNGVKLLDSSYVKQATTAADLINTKGEVNKNYGYHFWLTNHKKMEIFYARGLWGQYTICIPEKNMIVVRLGRKSGKHLNNGHHSDLYEFIDSALEM